MKTRLMAISIGALSLAGCATNPPVSYNYYLPKTMINATVTSTVGCDANKIPVVANDIDVRTVNIADSNTTYTFNTAKLGNAVSNSDFTVEYYPDGRLKSFNSESTGQAEKIINAAIDVAALVTKAGRVSLTDYGNECDFILKHGGKSKTLTVTLGATLLPTGATDSMQLDPDFSSEFYYNRLQKILGTVNIKGVSSVGALVPIAQNPKLKRVTELIARQPGLLTVQVNTQGGLQDGELWSGVAAVSQLGRVYSIYVPNAVFFGKRTFKLGLAESGAIDNITYTGETGAESALKSVKSVADELKGPTDSEKLSALKTKAEIIAAQEKLVGCRIDPANC